MKIIDLHPEELIDRARRGELTVEEQAHLDHHVARCSACRFELMLRADFAAEAGLAGSPSGLHALVSSALVAAKEPAAPVVKPRRPAAKTWSLGVAAAILLMTGMATAQLGVITQLMTFVVVQAKQAFGGEAREEKRPRAKSPKRERAHKVGEHATATARTQSAQAAEAVVTTPKQPANSHEVPASIEPTTAVGSDTAVQAASDPRAQRDEPPVRERSAHEPRSQRVASPVRASRRHSGTAPAPRSIAPSREAASIPTPVAEARDEASASGAEKPAPTESPALLFERANGLRRQGFAGEARSLYRYLETHYARSSEGRLSLAVLGRLELDRGDARAALRDFDAYLASGDVALREEVLAGRALAFGRLGQHSSECSAFAALLRAYPESTYASLAASRCSGDD